MLSVFSCVQLCVALWTAARQAPLSMGLSRQEYRSGLPFPSLWDLPDPGIEPRSPALQEDSLTTVLTGFLCGSSGRESACYAGELYLIPGSEDPWEKEMETHSSTLACKTPWTEEPGRLQSMATQLSN